MKKNIFKILIGSCFLFGGNINAQSKSAYISVDELVSIMPETLKIDSIINRFVTDSVSPIYNETLATYQSTLATFNDSLKTTPSVHQQAESSLQSLMYQLQNWDQITTQAKSAREQELLKPIYRKAYDAIKQVAKEKGFTHVLNKEAFLVAPEGEDLIIAVATKLKISLPKTITPGKNL